MNVIVLIIAFAFVISILAIAGFAIVQLSPFGRHSDRYRDPETGKRRFDSPRLD